MTTRPIERQFIAGHIGHWPDGRLKFPTLAGCLVCGGISSIVRPYPAHARYEPEEATRIALIEHGYHLAKWEGHNVANASHVPKACTCGHLHDFEQFQRPDAPAFNRTWLRCRICAHTQGKPDSSD